jgi:hypothetical protein
VINKSQYRGGQGSNKGYSASGEKLLGIFNLYILTKGQHFVSFDQVLSMFLSNTLCAGGQKELGYLYKGQTQKLKTLRWPQAK